MGLGCGNDQHSPSSSTFSPLLPCFSVPCVIKMWLAWDGFRSRLWPPLATRKAIWSTCWMGSPTRVPPASSQGTCSSSLAVVSSPPKGKQEEGGQKGGGESGQRPKNGHSPMQCMKTAFSAERLALTLICVSPLFLIHSQLPTGDTQNETMLVTEHRPGRALVSTGWSLVLQYPERLGYKKWRTPK